MPDWLAVEPLIDTPEQHAWFAPPEPKVGDRVRVRLNGECRVSGPGYRIEAPGEITDIGHPEWAEGVEGVVRPCLNGAGCEGFGGHTIVIALTAPNGQAWFGHYAACELELIP